MYTVRPIITYKNDISLPNCMYKVNNIHCENIKYKGMDQQQLTTNCNNVSLQVNIILKKQGLDMHRLEEHQLEILKQLSDLKLEMLSMKESLLKETSNGNFTLLNKINVSTPLILFINPLQIPYSILAVQKLWMKQNIGLNAKSYVHSSIVGLSSEAEEFINKLTTQANSCVKTKFILNLTLIWKDVTCGPELVIGSSMTFPIKGEVNILRYLNYIAPEVIVVTSEHETNTILDACFKLSKVRTQKETQALIRFFNAKLGKNTWICNTENLSLADIAVYSALKQIKNTNDFTQNVTKWFERCSNVIGN